MQRCRGSPRPEDLALGCPSRRAAGGLVPPPSVLAPGTALGLLRRRALPSAQVRGIVVAPKWLSHRTKQRGVMRSDDSAGGSIGVAFGQLELPPVGANSSWDRDAVAWASDGRGQPPDALDGGARTARNSPEINPPLPCAMSRQSYARLACVVPCEGRWGEQSRRQRTIAASRSGATTTGPETESEPTVRTQESPRPTKQSKGDHTPGATVMQQPGERPFPLDKLFQERSHRPWRGGPTFSRFWRNWRGYDSRLSVLVRISCDPLHRRRGSDRRRWLVGCAAESPHFGPQAGIRGGT
jgi:hypothetical protein